MLASMGLVTVLSFLPLPLVLVKAGVDGALFFVSHFIQRNWVFKQGGATPARLLKGGAHAGTVSASANQAA